MSDSRPSSRGGRRGANGTSARSNTNSSANTSSLSKNKTYASLKPEEKKQVEHVKELKPEWSDDQLIEFCGKYNYDANTIQQGLENIFEDAARENADEWTQVKKKSSVKPKSETPSAPAQPSSSSAGPRGPSAGRGRGASSTAAPAPRGASANRGGAGAPRGGRGGARPSTNAQSKPDAESGAWAHAAAGAGWGDNSNAQTVTGTATVSQAVPTPAAGVPPVVVPNNPFTGKDSFLDRLMAKERAKENEKLAAQQAAQKEKEDKERAIREAEEKKIRDAQEAEDRKIREAQEAQRRLEEEERQRQEAEARAQAEAQAAAEAAAAAQAAQEEEQRRQAEEAARQQQALEAEQAAQAIAALQLKQQQEAAAAQAAQSAQADEVLSPIGARGSGFGNKAPGSAWGKAAATAVQPAYSAAEFQTAEQSTVSALYSPEDPVILPQHLKDQASAFDAPISFGTFNLPRKTDSATSTTPSFNQSLVSPQEPANRFAQDAQTATTPQAAPATQSAAQTQAGDQSDALHQQPSAFMQFPGAMPPAGLGQRSGYEDPQMYNQFYPYMMPPQNFGGMPGYDENQGFFDPAYSYGRDARKQAGGIVPGGGRGNRNFRQGGFPGAGLGPNPGLGGLQGKDDKNKLGQQGPVQGVQPSKFTSSPPSGAQPQSVSPPPQNDQSPNAQNGPQGGTPPNFGPVSANPSSLPNSGSFDKSRGPKLPRAGGAYQPKSNFNKGPTGPAAQTFNNGGKQQGTYQNKKQFGNAAGPSGFNKKSQPFTPNQPQAAGQFQNPNPYYPSYNPYYAAPYYGQYPPGFGRGGFAYPQGYAYPPYGGHQSPTFEENYDKNVAPYAGYDASQGQDYSQWGPNSQLPMGQDDGSFAAQGVQAPPSPSAEQNKQQGLGGMDDRLGAAANPQIGGGRQMGRFQPQQGQQPQATQQQQYGAMPLNLGQQQYNYNVPHQPYPAQGYGYQQPASDPNQQQQYWQS